MFSFIRRLEQKLTALFMRYTGIHALLLVTAIVQTEPHPKPLVFWLVVALILEAAVYLGLHNPRRGMTTGFERLRTNWTQFWQPGSWQSRTVGTLFAHLCAAYLIVVIAAKLHIHTVGVFIALLGYALYIVLEGFPAKPEPEPESPAVTSYKIMSEKWELLIASLPGGLISDPMKVQPEQVIRRITEEEQALQTVALGTRFEYEVAMAKSLVGGAVTTSAVRAAQEVLLGFEENDRKETAELVNEAILLLERLPETSIEGIPLEDFQLM